MWYLIFAQIGRNPNEDIVTDFLNQLPTTLIMFVCGSAFLLLMAFVWFAYFKPLRKSRLKTVSPPPTPITSASQSQRQTLLTDDDDLPDLDMLLGQSASVPAIPSPPPEPAKVSTPVAPIVASPPPSVDAPLPPVRESGRMVRVQLHTGDVVRGQEVIVVLRDPRDGRLMVQVDGTTYRTLTESPDAKSQFVDVMRELNTVVNQPDDNPPPTEEQPAVPVPIVSVDGVVPGKLPSFKLEDNMQPTNKGVYQVGEVPELNLAEAIEAYLQYKIRQTPDYRNRRFHVHPAAGGGVRIQVDDDYYDAVSDIADTDARLFIQEAIQEWQTLNQ